MALSLVSREEGKLLNGIQRLLKREIEVEEIPEYQQEIVRSPQQRKISSTPRRRRAGR